MLVSLCVFLLVSSALSLPVGEKDLDAQFEEYKKKHEKVYSGPEEEAMRRDLWEKSLKHVETHNKEAEQGLHTYRIGINQFSDRTKEERNLGWAFAQKTDPPMYERLNFTDFIVNEGNSTSVSNGGGNPEI